MTDIEDKLSRVLAGAADQVPERARIRLSAAVRARRRPRRAPIALLAAAAVVVVAGGAGTAVRVLGPSAARQPMVNATGAQGPTPTPVPAPVPIPGKKPQPIEKMWPRALHKVPAKLPDGRAYIPQLLLDDRTLLVMTERVRGRKQFLWRYDLETGEPRRITEIPAGNSTPNARHFAASGGNIVWWVSHTEPGRPPVARIWTVPVGGGSPRMVADVPPDVAGKGRIIQRFEVVGSDVVFSCDDVGVYRVPLRGGEPRVVPGTEGWSLLRWPWAGRDTIVVEQVYFGELFNVETGERRGAVVKPDDRSVECGVDRCFGRSRTEGPVPRDFVRDRDGSREWTLPSGGSMLISGRERFYLRLANDDVFLDDLITGTSADLGMRRNRKGDRDLPEIHFDRLMAYPAGKKMYVVDLAAIK